MKSQDIFLLFKLASLHAQEENLLWPIENYPPAVAPEVEVSAALPSGVKDAGALAWLAVYDSLVDSQQDAITVPELESPSADLDRWEGWSDIVTGTPLTRWHEGYSLRALSASLGLSKSEISNSLVRCRNAGLLTSDNETSLPKVNRRALLKISEHALKHFFPVKPGAIVRGIPTGFAAPVLAKRLKSAGELIPVWPDPFGSERGQSIVPLYKTVIEAVKKDRTLYHYLALVDAIRVGGPRESAVAVQMLKAGLGIK